MKNKTLTEKKSHSSKCITHSSGITLVALIITIIVLLILAVVAIRAVTGDGIIKHAENAKSESIEAQDKEKIMLALNEWKIVKNTNAGITFENFMKESFGASKVQAGSTAEEVIVTLENGNQYKVKADGTITNTKGVSIRPSSLTLELQEGTTVTETLTATPSGIEGEITWSNSDDSIATISTTTGNSITVTAVAKGSTTITASCGGYTASCPVTVAESLAVGSYIQYDVPYTDMCSGIEYTANNGWRYLGKDDNGNNLLVSTGIPGILYYHYNTNKGNTVDGGANTWWATKAEISSTTDTLYRTEKGYDYNTDSGEPNKYAAYGMRYKFESIQFTHQESGTSVSTANTGIFRKVGSTTSGESINLNFKASGVSVVDVHNLTLAELNRATNKVNGNNNRADTSTGSGFKDLTGTAVGLFDMQDLENYTQNYYYWLASPFTSIRSIVYFVSYDNSLVSSGLNGSLGVRPVVTLSSDVPLAIVE